tara:strand:+ start:863 stop:1582 length:720 start_codon:yes stop_codon:yes gene_type:complete
MTFSEGTKEQLDRQWADLEADKQEALARIRAKQHNNEKESEMTYKKMLTVNELHKALTNHINNSNDGGNDFVLIATEGWYTHVADMSAPDENEGITCFTLFPDTSEPGGTFDPQNDFWNHGTSEKEICDKYTNNNQAELRLVLNDNVITGYGPNNDKLFSGDSDSDEWQTMFNKIKQMVQPAMSVTITYSFEAKQVVEIEDYTDEDDAIAQAEDWVDLTVGYDSIEISDGDWEITDWDA